MNKTSYKKQKMKKTKTTRKLVSLRSKPRKRDAEQRGERRRRNEKIRNSRRSKVKKLAQVIILLGLAWIHQAMQLS
jgi:hypothetical protein